MRELARLFFRDHHIFNSYINEKDEKVARIMSLSTPHSTGMILM